MKNFSYLEDSIFQKNLQGNGWIYFPFGSFGSGYLVVDELTKKNILKSQKSLTNWATLFSLLIILIVGINLLSFFAFLVIACLYFLFQTYKLRNFEKSEIKFDNKKAFYTRISNTPTWLIYIQYTLTLLLLTISSASLLFDTGIIKSINVNITILIASLFGLIFIRYIQTTKIKIQNANNTN